MAHSPDAAHQWVASLHSNIANVRESPKLQGPLLAQLVRGVSSAHSSPETHEIQEALLKALRDLENRGGSPSGKEKDAWCSLLVQKLKLTWKQPDGLLMAVTFYTTEILPTCPFEVLNFFGENKWAADLWSSNLDPAIFASGQSIDPKYCELRMDLDHTLASLVGDKNVGVTASQVRKAVDEVGTDCGAALAR